MSAYSSISLMDQEHLSGWAFHLCAPDLSHLSSSHLSQKALLYGLYQSAAWPPQFTAGSPGLTGMSAYCPGSLKWVAAHLKVTLPEAHSLPRSWVITAPLMLLPSPEETVPLSIILPYRPILNVSSLYWCDSDQHTKSYPITIPACQPSQTHASGWRYRGKIKMAVLVLVEVIFWISHCDWHREDNLLNG